MLCVHCGKNQATAFYKENINGQVRELALCSECAAKLVGQTPKFVSMFDSPFLDGGFFENPTWGSSLFEPQAINGGRRCKTCQMTESELRRTGRVGCGDCYSSFSDILLPYIKKLHGAAAHVGTAPKQTDINPIEDLKNRLAKAVESENYEEAARLRDEIRRQEEH